MYRSHPAGDIPGSRTSEIANRFSKMSEAKTVTQNVSLEAHELFIQLHFLVAVVQTGPHRALLSVENVIDKTQRLFRKWLAERAEVTEVHQIDASNSVTNELGYEANEIMWIDHNKIVGLKVRVKERKGRTNLPVLFHHDEDQGVSYSLDLEGKSPTQRSNRSQQEAQGLVLKLITELIVSHLHLMLAVERQLLVTGREGNGQAIIFGNFAIPTAHQTEEVSENIV